MQKIQQLARQLRQTAGMTALRATKALDDIMESIGKGFDRINSGTTPSDLPDRLDIYDFRLSDAIAAATRPGHTKSRVSIRRKRIYRLNRWSPNTRMGSSW
ncbi:MAG: hypothetical protein ED559_04095 [Phycisphaera sp.]|nr:MAG: hypothetical protein ED559_04095 [Phycisphaera sp.]